MATQTIVNAAPMAIPLGTDDLSKTVVPVAQEQIPQHLPIFYLFTQRGSGRNLVDGTSDSQIYGDATFDQRSAYFNHATLYYNEAKAQGNSSMIERVVPTDAGPKANAVVWLDVLQTSVDRYQRNPDGSIALDQFGDPTIIAQTPGLKVKWVKTNRLTLAEQETFGDKVQEVGDQVDSGTSTTSVRYPIFELEDSDQGADGNNTGFRLWAPTATAGNSLPTAMMQEYNVYPYMFSVVSRPDASSTPTPVKNINGETQAMFTFTPGVVNPLTDENLGWDQLIISSYNQIDNPGFPNIYGRLGRMFVYQANITAVQALMYEFESTFISANSDITEDPASAGLLNFVTGVSSQNIPYESYVFVDSPTSVRMSEYSNVFLTGGADGTLTNEMYESLVNAAMDRYADPTDEVQDMAYNVESVIYDSGFSLATKLKLAEFISNRPDTVAILGTHTVGQPVLTESEEHSVAVSLRTRLQMYPESTYFGTPVMRAMIMGRSGVVRNNDFTQPVPATFEVLSKFAAYMGAGNGAWKSGSSPEGAPGNVVTRLKDINITFVSNDVRNQDWSIGLNFILRFDRSNYFIPAYKTIYDDDTSVLNSIITAFAIAQLNKVAFACWRQFVGRSDLTDAQLTDRSNSFIRNAVAGRFDNRFVIIPAATVTASDALRGFSWSCPIKIGADNMKTVMTTWVEAYRQADLVPANSNTTGG